jgi:uncharacterized membrane protein YgdD (TMEM256/DUF423 family)
MANKILQLGAILGALSVILGAFAAHSLKNYLTPEQLEIFQTGVRYQFYHTFAILIVGVICLQYSNRFFKYSAIAFLVGILCFSGSLYLLASRFTLGIASWTWLGPVTPIGGLLFLIGWIFLALGASKIRRL